MVKLELKSNSIQQQYQKTHESINQTKVALRRNVCINLVSQGSLICLQVMPLSGFSLWASCWSCPHTMLRAWYWLPDALKARQGLWISTVQVKECFVFWVLVACFKHDIPTLKVVFVDAGCACPGVNRCGPEPVLKWLSPLMPLIAVASISILSGGAIAQLPRLS